VRNCAVCNLNQQSRQTPCRATLKPMQEFHPMAVLHADLVGPLPEGRNSRNQRGFKYILSVEDSATRYLWLLPIRHKTAEAVAATLFDEVILRVSAILTDRGGEFLGEVVEMLYKRLGMAHLKTSAYRPQTDAKCERVHFSMHNFCRVSNARSVSASWPFRVRSSPTRTLNRVFAGLPVTISIVSHH